MFERRAENASECSTLNRLFSGCLEDNSVEKLQVMEFWLVKFQRETKGLSGLFM